MITVLFLNLKVEYESQYNITSEEIKGLNKISEIYYINRILKKEQFNLIHDNKNVKNLYDTLKRLDNLKDNNLSTIYKEMIFNGNKSSKNDLLQFYNILITSLNKKMDDLSDSSYLLFEPDRDMYYLMLISTVEIHKIEKYIHNIRSSTIDKDIYTIKKNIDMFKEALEDIGFYLSKLNQNDSNRLKILLDVISNKIENIYMITNDKKSFDGIFNDKNFLGLNTNLLKEIDDFLELSKNLLDKKLEFRKQLLSEKLSFAYILYFLTVLIILFVAYYNLRAINRSVLEEEKKKSHENFISLLKEDYSRNLSLQQIYDISLSYLVSNFNALNGSLYIYNSDNQKLYLASTFAIKKRTLTSTLDINDNIISQNILDNKIKITDIDKEVSLGNITLNISKLITIPIIEFDKSIGVIQLSYDERYKNIDLKYLESIVSFMAKNINKAQLDDKTSKYIKLIDQNVSFSKTDTKGNIIDVTEAFCKLSGYSKEELIGKKHNILRHPDVPESTYKDMWETIKNGEIWMGEIKNKNKEGGFYWVYSIVSPDFDINGNIVGYTALRNNITDKKKIEEIAIVDKLTSLYNRRHFDNIFVKQIAASKRDGAILAFAIIDIDHFKQYNDTYGHQKGDETLMMVAKTLKKSLKRTNDYTFRLGGEEFGLVYNVSNSSEAIKIANDVRRDVENLNIEHLKNDNYKHVTISIGLYIIDEFDTTSSDTIYKKADEALYKAKNGGRNRVYTHK